MKMLKVFGVLIAIYCISFFILMDIGSKAVDENYNVRYKHSFRYHENFPMVDPELGLTRTYRFQSFWNRFFYPFEVFRFR